MANQVIICPYCHKEIPLTEALSHQIKEDLRKEFDAEIKKKESDLAQKENGLIKKEKALEEEYTRKLKQERAKLEEESKQKAKESVAVELKIDNAFGNSDFSDSYKLFGTMGVRGIIDVNQYFAFNQDVTIEKLKNWRKG